jgi:hypothetical protein
VTFKTYRVRAVIRIQIEATNAEHALNIVQREIEQVARNEARFRYLKFESGLTAEEKKPKEIL